MSNFNAAVPVKTTRFLSKKWSIFSSETTDKTTPQEFILRTLLHHRDKIYSSKSTNIVVLHTPSFLLR